MQRLLDQSIHHHRHAECPHPARRLRDVHSTHRPRQVTPFQQRPLHTRPVHLEPVFELGHRHAIDARCSLVLDHSLVRQPHVAAFDHALHQRVVLRFRSPGCRRVDLGTEDTEPEFRLRPLQLGRRSRERFCLIESTSRSSVLLSVSVVRPFGRSRDLLWPRLTSDDASENLSILVAQRHAARSPRVLRTHLHAYACRIYAASFRASTGLCISWPSHPACAASIRFLFVAPALCLRLPPDLQSPGDTLAAPLTLPLAGCVEDFHLQVSAPCRAHEKAGNLAVAGQSRRWRNA